MRTDIGARVGEGRRGEQRQSEHGARVTTFGGVPGDRRGIGPVHRSVDDGRRVTGVAGIWAKWSVLPSYLASSDAVFLTIGAADQTILAVVCCLVGHDTQRQIDFEEAFTLVPVNVGVEIERV